MAYTGPFLYFVEYIFGKYAAKLYLCTQIKTMMKHLCTYNPLKRLLQNEQICCCSVVHVHWFSGFI